MSIRRRRLLGLCSGQDSFSAPTPEGADPGQPVENCAEDKQAFNVLPMPSNGSYKPKEESSSDSRPVLSNVTASSPSNEQLIREFPEIKRRKRHRRKHVENQEPCIMRGVYFKNLKWQAAIKVDKKQIHLGTVGSQEEAARLYDRAAFMCGREPNFELSEEEKHELKKFNWDEFLIMTRSAITNKKSQRRSGAGSRRRVENNLEEWEQEDEREHGLSASEKDTIAP